MANGHNDDANSCSNSLSLSRCVVLCGDSIPLCVSSVASSSCDSSPSPFLSMALNFSLNCCMLMSTVVAAASRSTVSAAEEDEGTTGGGRVGIGGWRDWVAVACFVLVGVALSVCFSLSLGDRNKKKPLTAIQRQHTTLPYHTTIGSTIMACIRHTQSVVIYLSSKFRIRV